MTPWRNRQAAIFPLEANSFLPFAKQPARISPPIRQQKEVPMKRCLLAAVFGAYVSAISISAQAPPKMTLHFTDVGQGLSALIEFPCGAMLIDAGADIKRSFAVMNYLKTFFLGRTDLDRALDNALITHNRIDHDSQLQEIVNSGIKIKRHVDDGILSGKGAILNMFLSSR